MYLEKQYGIMETERAPEQLGLNSAFWLNKLINLSLRFFIYRRQITSGSCCLSLVSTQRTIVTWGVGVQGKQLDCQALSHQNIPWEIHFKNPILKLCMNKNFHYPQTKFHKYKNTNWIWKNDLIPESANFPWLPCISSLWHHSSVWWK